MTSSGLIEKTDALFPNVYPFSQKAQWLTAFDKRLYEEFLSRYEGALAPDGGDCPCPGGELLLGEEYAELYINYIAMLMELYSGNITGYQNKAALFNSHYLSFISSYNRTHLIRGVKITVK